MVIIFPEIYGLLLLLCIFLIINKSFGKDRLRHLVMENCQEFKLNN